MFNVKKGDLFYADLSPAVGSEQGGLRPVVVIQNDIGNKYAPTTIVASITSQINKSKLPTHVEILANEYGLNRNSIILLEQIRTLDKRRLKEKISTLTKSDISKVNRAIDIALDLEEENISCNNNEEIKDINIAINLLKSVAQKYDIKEACMENYYKDSFESITNNVIDLNDEIKNIYSVITPFVEKQKIAKGKLAEYAVIEYFKNNDYESEKADTKYDALKIDVISKNDINKIFIQVKAGQISIKEIIKLVKNVSELDSAHDENCLIRVAGVCADTFPPNSDIVRMRLEKEFGVPIMFIHKYQILKLQPEFKSTIN